MGVGLLSMSETLKHHRRTDIPERSLEFVGIEVELIKARPFLVAAWYRPPSDPVDSFTKLERNIEFFDREIKKSFSLVIQIVTCLYWKVLQTVLQIIAG